MAHKSLSQKLILPAYALAQPAYDIKQAKKRYQALNSIQDTTDTPYLSGFEQDRTDLRTVLLEPQTLKADGLLINLK